MKRHQISLSDLDDFIIEKQIAAQHGNGISKTLTCEVDVSTCKLWFVVCNQKERVAVLNTIECAIEKYNAI